MSAREDGYVECAECGHLIERHDRDGCQAVPGCECPQRLTKKTIEAIRRANGLPRRMSPDLLWP